METNWKKPLCRARQRGKQAELEVGNKSKIPRAKRPVKNRVSIQVFRHLHVLFIDLALVSWWTRGAPLESWRPTHFWQIIQSAALNIDVACCWLCFYTSKNLLTRTCCSPITFSSPDCLHDTDPLNFFYYNSIKVDCFIFATGAFGRCTPLVELNGANKLLFLYLLI